jgi:hypothetical protein
LRQERVDLLQRLSLEPDEAAGILAAGEVTTTLSASL